MVNPRQVGVRVISPRWAPSWFAERPKGLEPRTPRAWDKGPAREVDARYGGVPWVGARLGVAIEPSLAMVGNAAGCLPMPFLLLVAPLEKN